MVGVVAIVDGIRPVFLADFQAFEVAGRVLLSAHGLHVFDDPSVEVGPLHLLFNGLIDLVAGLFVVQPQTLLSLVVQVGYVLGLVLVGRALVRARGNDPDWRVEAGIVVAALAFAISWRAYHFGHAGEAFIPLLWILGAQYAGRDKTWIAGGLLALAVGIEPWAVVGIPLLFLMPSLRVGMRTGAIAAAGGLLIYAPFILGGSVASFGGDRQTFSESLLVGFLAGPGDAFTWQLRLVQLLCVLAVGAALVVWARRRASQGTALWAIPIALAGTRLLLHPSDAIYLWLPFQTAALVGLVVCLTGKWTTKSLVLAAGTYPLFLEPTTGFLGAWALGLAVVACAWPDRAPREDTAASSLPPVTTPV